MLTPMVAPDTPDPPSACDEDAPFDPGPMMPRRLSQVEYANTVRALFGDDIVLGVAFPPDEEMLGFDNNARGLQVTPIHTERYMESAEGLASQVVDRLSHLLPCDPESEPRACAQRFLETFGLRAWRRPLTDEELSRYMGVYDAVMAGDETSFPEAVEVLISGLLQSPHFLYRIEIGLPSAERPDLRVLNSFEMASRLSYFIWRSMPDEVLMEAAVNGGLDTPESLAAEARRMLAAPQAREAFWTFFAQWLHLDELPSLVRDPRYYPDFDATARAELEAGARGFVDQAVWGTYGSMRDLFAREFVLPGDPPDVKRIGILSHPAILAVTSSPTMTSPVHRGIFVREQVMCMTLPPPPPDVTVVAPDPDPNLTTREQFAIHSSDPSCAGCHSLIDPVGFLFEGFDAVGAWRNQQNNRYIDTSGDVIAAQDVTGLYEGAADFSAALADSDLAHRCVVTQMMRYAFGRGEVPADACLLEAVEGAYQEADYDFGALVGAIVVTESFRHRRGDLQ